MADIQIDLQFMRAALSADLQIPIEGTNQQNDV